MEKQISQSIHIHASPEQVWDTLTNPEKIAQYLYGARTETDWEPGSPVIFYMTKDGHEFPIVKGNIVKMEVHRHFENTLFPMGWEGLDDVPENYLTCVYQIKLVGTEADLTITMHDYTKVGMGERRYQDTLNSFDQYLANIKAVAEK